jgi:hypothetical protein
MSSQYFDFPDILGDSSPYNYDEVFLESEVSLFPKLFPPAHGNYMSY